MKLNNYIASLILGVVCIAGYFIIQSKRASKEGDNVAVQRLASVSDEPEEHRHAAHELAMKEFVTEKERRELFKLLGIEYLEREIFDYAPCLDIDARETDMYLDDVEYYDEISDYYKDDVEEGGLVPMSVRWLGPEIGYGVFAEVDLDADDFIGTYTGVVEDRAIDENKDYSWAYPILSADGEQSSLNGIKKGNELRFINDGADPNCIIRYVIGNDNLWHLCYAALKDIKKGEQLLISYGPAYWETRDYKYKELAEQQ